MRIIFSSILCFFVFKIKFARHHILSIVIIIIGICSASIPVMVAIPDIIGVNYFIFKILENVMYSILEVVEKYYMHFKFISPYQMLFYQGVVTLSLQIITLTSFSYISCKGILNDLFCNYHYFVEIEQFYNLLLALKLLYFLKN